jgi:hypothetical protein
MHTPYLRVAKVVCARVPIVAIYRRMHTHPIDARVDGAQVPIVAIVGVLALQNRRSACAGGLGADAATALTILLARLPIALALVGRSLTDAERSKRAPDDGSTHQPERLASREGAICQSSSQIVEEAIFSGHRLSPPRM